MFSVVGVPLLTGMGASATHGVVINAALPGIIKLAGGDIGYITGRASACAHGKGGKAGAHTFTVYRPKA